jgi:hypothetical protein
MYDVLCLCRLLLFFDAYLHNLCADMCVLNESSESRGLFLMQFILLTVYCTTIENYTNGQYAIVCSESSTSTLRESSTSTLRVPFEYPSSTLRVPFEYPMSTL